MEKSAKEGLGVGKGSYIEVSKGREEGGTRREWFVHEALVRSFFSVLLWRVFLDEQQLSENESLG